MPVDGGRWFAPRTHSHCEQLVCAQLRGRGYEAFLPFPGYLFLHHADEIRDLVQRHVVTTLRESLVSPDVEAGAAATVSLTAGQ